MDARKLLIALSRSATNDEERMSAIGENCTSACKSRDHATFGECVRSQGHYVAYCQSHKGHDATRQKKWDAELNLYQSARSQGIQPAGTSTRAIEKAFDISERTGRAFDASAASGGMR